MSAAFAGLPLKMPTDKGLPLGDSAHELFPAILEALQDLGDATPARISWRTKPDVQGRPAGHGDGGADAATEDGGKSPVDRPQGLPAPVSAIPAQWPEGLGHPDELVASEPRGPAIPDGQQEAAEPAEATTLLAPASSHHPIPLVQQRVWQAVPAAPIAPATCKPETASQSPRIWEAVSALASAKGKPTGEGSGVPNRAEWMASPRFADAADSSPVPDSQAAAKSGPARQSAQFRSSASHAAATAAWNPAAQRNPGRQSNTLPNLDSEPERSGSPLPAPASPAALTETPLVDSLPATKESATQAEDGSRPVSATPAIPLPPAGRTTAARSVPARDGQPAGLGRTLSQAWLPVDDDDLPVGATLPNASPRLDRAEAAPNVPVRDSQPARLDWTPSQAWLPADHDALPVSATPLNALPRLDHAAAARSVPVRDSQPAGLGQTLSQAWLPADRSPDEDARMADASQTTTQPRQASLANDPASFPDGTAQAGQPINLANASAVRSDQPLPMAPGPRSQPDQTDPQPATRLRQSPVRPAEPLAATPKSTESVPPAAAPRHGPGSHPSEAPASLTATPKRGSTPADPAMPHGNTVAPRAQLRLRPTRPSGPLPGQSSPVTDGGNVAPGDPATPADLEHVSAPAPLGATVVSGSRARVARLRGGVMIAPAPSPSGSAKTSFRNVTVETGKPMGDEAVAAPAASGATPNPQPARDLPANAAPHEAPAAEPGQIVTEAQTAFPGQVSAMPNHTAAPTRLARPGATAAPPPASRAADPLPVGTNAPEAPRTDPFQESAVIDVSEVDPATPPPPLAFRAIVTPMTEIRPAAVDPAHPMPPASPFSAPAPGVAEPAGNPSVQQNVEPETAPPAAAPATRIASGKDEPSDLHVRKEEFSAAPTQPDQGPPRWTSGQPSESAPAPRPADHPARSAAPPAPAVRNASEMPEAGKAPAQPVRDIKLDLGTGDGRVEVRVADRGGELKVAVHTPDERLASDLRDHLPSLSSRLEQSGLRAETWHAAAAGNADRLRPQTASSSDSPSPGGQDHPQGREQQEDNPPRRSRPAAGTLPNEEKGDHFAWLMDSLG